MTRTYTDANLKELCDKLKGLGRVHSYYRMKYLGNSKWEDQHAPEQGTKSVPLGDLREATKDSNIEWEDFFVPFHVSYGDYAGSAVDRANHDAFTEKYGEQDGVLELYGDFYYHSVAVRLDSITDEMVEDFTSLIDYPVMDDEKLSNLEMQLEEEDWKSWIAGDLRRALVKKFPDREDDLDALHEKADESNSKFYDLYRALCERTNTNWNSESAVGGHVDIDRLVAGATDSDIPTMEA